MSIQGASCNFQSPHLPTPHPSAPEYPNATLTQALLTSDGSEDGPLHSTYAIDQSNSTSSTPSDSSAQVAQNFMCQAQSSEVDAIIHHLDFPRTVAKVVAEYQPTTRKQLLCELKKEVARVKWVLRMRNEHEAQEVLEAELREIEIDCGKPEEGDQEGTKESIETLDVEELTKLRGLGEKGDKQRNLSNEDRESVKS